MLLSTVCSLPKDCLSPMLPRVDGAVNYVKNAFLRQQQHTTFAYTELNHLNLVSFDAESFFCWGKIKNQADPLVL